MFHQHATFDPQGDGTPVGLPGAALPWLKPMQLPVMPVQGSDAHQPRRVGRLAPSHGTVGQHPGIDTMGMPHLSQLLARLLKAQLLTECFCLVALLGLMRNSTKLVSQLPLVAPGGKPGGFTSPLSSRREQVLDFAYPLNSAVCRA